MGTFKYRNFVKGQCQIKCHVQGSGVGTVLKTNSVYYLAGQEIQVAFRHVLGRSSGKYLKT